MAEPTVEEAQGWVGSRLDEIGGAGVGKIEGVYVDAVTGEPEWLLARIGHFGRHGLVPVRYAAAAAKASVGPVGARGAARRSPRRARSATRPRAGGGALPLTTTSSVRTSSPSVRRRRRPPAAG